MEKKQLVQINNLSKDELVEHINSFFGRRSKSSMIIAILWGIIAIDYLYLGIYTSESGMPLPCLWLLISLLFFFQFLQYRKMGKENSAKGLLTCYDKYKKIILYSIPIIILLFCYPIYVILAEKPFAPNVGSWIICIISGLMILFFVWYLFSPKFRTKIENSGSDSINLYVERLRELVEQEEGKSEKNV